MSRVIKFRAWDGLRMVRIPFYVNCEGNLYKDNDPHGLDMSGKRSISPMPNCVVMQSTGLHDKNGIEIYEGDILSFFGDPIAVVEWQDFGGWSYRWIGSTYERVRQRNPEPFFTNINLWSVIGNIYQNPELLNHTQP